MKVLAADDDPSVQRMLRRTLGAWGYDVTVVGSGAEAWAALKKDSIPIVTLDWEMPELCGIDVCRLLRSTPHGPNAYILILTAKSQQTDLIEALEAGADDFIHKPFEPRELQLRIAKGVREQSSKSRRPFGAGFPAAGATLGGKFRLEQAIGHGGFGTVWLGQHLALGVNVAVKVMHANLAARTDFSSFQREARAAAQLRSPHTVRIYDHGIAADGIPYMVMEYLAGESLGQLVRRSGALPIEDVADVVDQTASSLTEAHGCGLVHRDVKPDNMLLVEDSESKACVKLIDFGLVIRSSAGTISPDQRAGTLDYMSPEYLTEGRVDPMLDLWGLACSAFEALTGVRAFSGESPEAIYEHIRFDPLPVPSRLAADLPPSIDAWFARACARDRAKRFGSARALAQAFRDAVASPARCCSRDA